MKWWTLMMWVTQFGVSALFPLCAFLLIGAWLQNTFDLSPWITVLLGVFGFVTSISTVRICYRFMRKEADAICEKEQKVPAYNDHD